MKNGEMLLEIYKGVSVGAPTPTHHPTPPHPRHPQDSSGEQQHGALAGNHVVNVVTW